MKKLLLICTKLSISFACFSQTTIDQNGIKTTVTNIISANATQAMRYEVATIGYNSYHWQTGGLIIIELFDQTYATGYEKYVVENGYLQGANSGSPAVKLIESQGLLHDAKISVGDPYDLSTTVAGYVDKALPVYVDIKNYAGYKVRLTYMQNKVDEVTSLNQIAINIAPGGVEIPGFVSPALLNNNLTSTGSLMVTGSSNHYISNGNVGIGTVNPTEKLSVNGNIRAKEIKVEAGNWPDYIFKSDYNLPSLKETEAYIKQTGHLRGIPSAKEVKANGIDVGEMNTRLLEKIEELTLHLIEIQKENEVQNEKLTKEIDNLKIQLKKSK